MRCKNPWSADKAGIIDPADLAVVEAEIVDNPPAELPVGAVPTEPGSPGRSPG